MSTSKKASVLTPEEKAAMRALVKERKAAAEGEEAIGAALKEMTPADRKIGQRIHAIVKEVAPELTPRTWYGMPAYARDGKVMIYFRDAAKFKERYAVLGFQDNANLDQGTMWPVVYALPKLTEADEKKIRALVKQALRR